MAGGVVIVGSGQAGVQTAFSLRDEGYDGSVTIVGDEAGLPYQRPPLSKAYLLGKMDDQHILLKGAALYSGAGVTLMDGVRAQSIDREAKALRLSSGRVLAYDQLVLATGARQRTLDIPGATLDGVLSLRTLQDAKALMVRLDEAKRVVVIGGGFIGLEFAAVARAKGIEVVVVEAAPRPMGRALSTEMARFFEERHIGWGSSFLFGALVTGYVGEGKVSGVVVSDGITIPADLVLVGVGVVPNVELAQAAALDVDDGIVVDGQMRSRDPVIFAIGDCARHPNAFSAVGEVRVESVQNATDQARCVAGAIMGKAKIYDTVPWFWSDQGDLKLQIAGLSTGYDTAVVRGDISQGAFSVFCFSGERLLAVESVNRGPDHIMARRLIAAGVAITPAQAADDRTPLKTHLAAAAGHAAS